MDHQRWSLRWGACAILCALLLRLSAAGFFQPVAEFLAKPNIASLLIYLETGRIVRFSPSAEVLEVFAYESAVPDFALETAAPTQPAEEELPLPVFCAVDAENIKFKNSAGVKFDAGELVTQPLQWDLTSGEPAVLILHTHTTESYTRTDGEDYKETSAFRTLDENYNMICVGDRLAEILEESGITVLHDRKLHDYPSYNGSYSNARKEITHYLEENPSIRLVLDLHRDASGDLKNQMRTKATVDGKSSAQIMFVVGTGASGWKENFSLALKMQVQLERLAPGICRNINLRTQRFNQDKLPGTLLVEVGAAGNTRAEALTAVETLAQAIIDLSKGAETVE
ncbi:MAG: stage II sporulation protein P [Oscillospiraceae bacterium]|nr:stage II sporulation protein P [Oscillospiraceae bacterium]